ncbi:MAG: permease-like cell division protein FtsX [Oscillospiraceae bacterium]|nr:permease-like cell division protein FtsX [Oscillospiraceae bacterium]
MRRFRFNAGYYIKEGFLSIFAHGLMSFAAVCMMIACLLIMGTFILIAVDLDYNLSLLQQENEFLVYLDEDMSEEDARALQSTIEEIPNVASAEFTSRDDAWEEFTEDQDNELYDTLDSSVVRHRYSIRVDDISKLDETVAAVNDLDEVVNYRASFEVADGLISARNVAFIVAAVIIIVLLLITLFIVYNTVRLATFSRRDEIAVMKIVGATNRFIRWPFIVEGMILGAVGAIIAFFLEWGIYTLIVDAIDRGGLMSVVQMLSFSQLWAPILIAFGAFGLLIGALGSAFAVTKYLRV